jgi:hypothetical protein
MGADWFPHRVFPYVWRHYVRSFASRLAALDVALEQNAVWTGSILTTLQFGIDPRRIAHGRERIGLLTIEDLRDTFRKYFPANRRTVISLLPEGTSEPGTVLPRAGP